MAWIRWNLPTALLAAAVLVLGVTEAVLTWSPGPGNLASRLVVAVIAAAAVLLHRARPGWAAGLFWLGSVLLLARGVEVMAIQLTIVVVYFGLGRWARPWVAWAWVAATVAIAVLTGRYVYYHATVVAELTGLSRLLETSSDPTSVFVLAAILPVVVPLVVGLILRLQARTHAAELGRASALDLAEQSAGESQLARDVHDVVGHSLATILIQAESGRYTEDDPAQLKATLARIAGSARQSLVEVRSLLESTAPSTTELDEVIAMVQDAGAPVDSRTEGTPRSLPPDVATVAVRVLQEMLTNALRHGVPDAEIRVDRIWRDGLTLVTSNDYVPNPAGPTAQREGTGLSGMRHRVEAIGGRLHVTRTDARFTVRAWLPNATAFTPVTL